MDENKTSPSLKERAAVLLYGLIRAFFSAWCLLSGLYTVSTGAYKATVGVIPFTDLQYRQFDDLTGFLLMLLGLAAVIFLLDWLLKSFPIGNWILLASLLFYAVLLLNGYRDSYFAIAVLLFVGVLVAWLIRENRMAFSSLHLSYRAVFVLTVVLGVGMAAFISAMTVSRYLTYNAPNFDFGLFCNMFYNMKKTGLPTVTSERDMLLSHFAVHISPIYYLILPFFCLFPSPITLQVAQGIIVASGIIPMYLIAKKLSLSPKITLALCAVYALYPAFSCGCSYDIHENAFLAPLLLWLFYFIEKEQWLPMYGIAILTLAVKEDAAVYVAFAALFLILNKKKYAHGLILFAASVAYFAFAVWLLDSQGAGAMTYRYGNFIFNSEDGLVGMFKTLLVNPALIFTETFTEKKLIFFLQMLLPLAFIPFSSKKLSRFVLILPLWLINLMPDYQYQHNIFFQYVFGSGAFLLYFAALNLRDLQVEARRVMASLAVVGALCVFCTTSMSKMGLVGQYSKYEEHYDRIAACLEVIPDEASVEASTMFVAHLADRDVIYQLGTVNHTEYLVLDLRYSKDQSRYRECIDQGMEPLSYYEGYVAVFQNPPKESPYE